MTETEFAEIALMLKTFYSKEKELLPNKEAMTLWYGMLKDIPLQTAKLFLQKWFATESWSPSVADIRKGCVDIVQGETPDWGEGWHEVQSAIRKYGYMQPTKALNSMSPSTRKAVECIGWQNICESDNIETTRAQFRQIYEIQSARADKQAVIPASVRNMIASIQMQSLPDKEVKLIGNNNEIR